MNIESSRTRKIVMSTLTFLLLSCNSPAFAGVPAVKVLKVKDGIVMIDFPNYPTGIGNVLYFSGREVDTNNIELWRTDGTEQGTYMVKDIKPGPESSFPYQAVVVNETLFFLADDGVHGRELWKSDGTEAGTVLVRDIWPGAVDYRFRLVNLNGSLLFSADDGVHGMELWRSDGTASGTMLVKDIKPGAGGSSIYGMVSVDGTLFFRADDGTHGNELWKSDGTSSGTVMVKDIWPGASGRGFCWLVNVEGMLFFWEPEGGELWKSDGTASGTVLVKDVCEGNVRSHYCTYAGSIGKILYFVPDHDVHGRELWKSDGTEAGTVLVKDIYPGSGGSRPDHLTNLDGAFFFSAIDGIHGYELWRSDGTEAGTVLVKDISPGFSGSHPEYLTFVNGTLFFEARDVTHGQELWMSDGTEAGTVLVEDQVPGPDSACPHTLTNVNETLYYVFGATGLWKAVFIPSPPVVTGTTPISNTTPTWTWTSGGGGNGTFRYKLDDDNLESGATTISETSFTPDSPLTLGEHTLYVQERNNGGYWSDSGSFTITIEVNDPPVAQAGTAGTDCDLAVSIPLFATDPEGAAVTLLLVDGPKNGRAIIDGSTAAYYPDVDFIGTDFFTFKANDGTSDSNIATVSITVNPVERLSAAVNVSHEKHIFFFARRIEAEDFSLSGQSTTALSEFSRGMGVQLSNNSSIKYTIPFATAPYILSVRYKTTGNTGSNDELVVYVNAQEEGRVNLTGEPEKLYLKKTADVSLKTNDTVNLQLSGVSTSVANLDYIEFFPTQSDASDITVTQAAGQTIKAGEQLSILIPAGIFSYWDKSVSFVTLGGNASGKVDPNVSYALDNKACILDVTQDFSAGDEIRISGLKFISQYIASGPGRLKLALNLDWRHVASARQIVCTPIASVKMGARSLNSGQPEVIGPVTIVDMIPAQIEQERGLKLVIPDNVPVTWDNSITTVTLSGTAKDRVSNEVTYSDNNKEVILQIKKDFFFADCLKVSGLKAKAGQDCLFRGIRLKDTAGYAIAEQN